MNSLISIVNRSCSKSNLFKRLNKGLSLIFLAVLFCTVPVISVAHEDGNKSVAEQGGQESNTPLEKEKKLAELQPKAAELETRLLDMRAALIGIDDTQDIEEKISQIIATQNEIVAQFHILKTNPEENARHLTQLQNELQLIERNISLAAGSLDSSIETLEKWMDYWASEEKDLAKWRTGLGPSNFLPPVQKIILQLQATKNVAREEIDNHLLPLLELQGKSGKLQVAAHKLHLEVSNLFKNRYQEGLYRQAPPLLSHEFISKFNTKLRHDAQSGVLQILRPDIKFLLEQQKALITSGILFLVLLWIFTLSKSYLKSSTHWSFVFNRSGSVAVFVSLFVFFLVADKPPPFWLAVFRAVTLVTVVRISREMIKDALLRSGLTKMITLLLVTDLLGMANVPMPLMRLYIICVSISLLLFLWLRQKRYEGKVTTYPWLVWGARFAFVFLLVVLLAEIFGQAELAFFVFSASLTSLFKMLILWIAYLIIMGMVELTLHFIPVTLVRENAGQIAQMICPIPILGCLLYVVTLIMVDWRLFSTVKDGLTFLSELGFVYGEINISLGLLLDSAFVLYTSYCFSRILQSILLQSVLPRQNVNQGIQLSITRLMHYAIMLTGFLVALGALGFSLTNLTILGGALGVGIGFGLQEIIKNFACGLILLFERPIKLGDTIQVGEEMAVVKALGLRATVVQTPDNAEIVLPNSDLITGQVTNWTLQERQARVKVPVGVAYGSNVELVMQILQACAEENPLVLATPKANVLFLAFGASSLDFELRVFIPEFTDRRLVLSELNLAINSEFEAAGIEIPFPQNDLHLRSVDPAAMSLLKGKSE